MIGKVGAGVKIIIDSTSICPYRLLYLSAAIFKIFKIPNN